VASPDTVEILRELIGFDTTSRLSNLPMMHRIREMLAGFGVASELIESPDGTKANVWATIGPADRPGIILSGHTDVVPVEGQDWTDDPFTMVERDGKLFGRGTADMKGFVAAAIAAVPRMLEADLAVPFHLAFSYDEEVGCNGVRGLIDRVKTLAVKPAICIVGEPTDMRVIIGHKGGRGYRCHVRGTEAHSSLAPLSVNAIEWAAELIVFIRALARRLAEEGPRDPEFDVVHTTISTGQINGGTAINIVPNACDFIFEFRHLASVAPESVVDAIATHAHAVLEPQMKALAPQTGFGFEPIYEYPALDMAPDDPLVTTMKRLVGRNDHAKVAYGTEGGLFQRDLGVPTVVCGPGSIVQAHKPDEWIAIEQLRRCDAFLERLVAHAVEGRVTAAA
jgi:acetylornithine deacetylase